MAQVFRRTSLVSVSSPPITLPSTGQSRTPIGPYDQMIAGHARSQGLILVSNNLCEFERVPELRAELGMI